MECERTTVMHRRAGVSFNNLAPPVIEAWSFGKPTIMSDTPHVSGLIEIGVDGLIVPMNDPQQLADWIYQLLANKELSYRLGEKRLSESVATL